MFKFFFLVLFIQDTVETVDVATFKQQYQAAILSTQAVYDRLFIAETTTSFGPAKQQKSFATGGMCGDFLKHSQTGPGDNPNSSKEFLSRENCFRMYKNLETNQYVLQYHNFFNTEIEFANAKKAVKSRFPSSFRLPFHNPTLGLTILDMLEGKPPRAHLYRSTYSVDRIEKHGQADRLDFYRIHFSTQYQDEQPERFYLEVNPHLAWSVTYAKSKSEEYRMEYGNKIDNIPILKKTTHFMPMTNEDTKQISMKPSYVIEVDHAELYVNVDPKEFDITSHGIAKPPRPLRPGELPLAVWIGIAVLFVFITTIQIIQYMKKKSKQSPPGTVRRLIRFD